MLVIALSTLFWVSFWWYVNNRLPLPPKVLKEEDPWKRECKKQTHFGYYLSLVNAVMFIFVAGVDFIAEPYVTARPNSALVLTAIKISLPYLFLDTITGYYYGFNDWAMNFHHILVFTAYAQSFYFRRSGVEMNYCLFFGELTNPLNIMRIIYEDHGRKKASELCALLFMVIFVLVRGPFSVYMSYEIVLPSAVNYVLKITYLLTCTLK